MRTLCGKVSRLGGAVFLAAMAATALPAHALPPPAKGDPQYWTAYNAGLMAMRDFRLDEAIAAFTTAIHRSPDPHAYLARAAAYTLQEKYQDAIDDLAHSHMPAGNGRNPSREPQLWSTSIWAMSNIAPADAEANGIGGQTWFSGMPGHLVQGGDDYPTDYGSLIGYEMGMAVYDLKRNNKDPHTPAMKAVFQKVAQWFANRALAVPEMAQLNYQYARQLLDKKQPAAALNAVNLVQVLYPFDADVRMLAAEAYLMMGRNESARREFTISLTMVTNAPAGYRGRALAAAGQGDARRALDDLGTLSKYDAAMASGTMPQVTSLLAREPITETVPALLSKLDADSGAGSSIDQLLPIALKLQRKAAETRVRYDELYQDHLRRLEDVTRDKPANPDGYVALAAYILEELSNRGESVEPRHGEQDYRYQFSQQMEVSRAVFALNQALRINPRHVAALVRMAYALDALGHGDKAEDCIDQAMEISGTKDADAIRLLAEYRASQAGSLRARAASLRTPRVFSNSHTENRSDGVYNVTTTTYIDPSPADLEQAAEADRDARALVEQAKTLMESAMKRNPDSLEGMLLKASYESWFGTKESALGILQQTAKKYPTSLKANDALTDFELSYGMYDEWIEARMVASKLYQTTAAPLLERIWKNIHVNGWPPLMADLTRAREADPTDARTTAYLAAAQADDKQQAAADASVRVAIALELARLQQDDSGEGAAMPRPTADFGLLMRLYAISALRDAKSGQMEEATTAAKAAAGFVARFDAGGTSQQMFGAMIPNPRDPEIPVPAPVNGATLAAQADVILAQIYQAQNDLPDALNAYVAAVAFARQYNSRIPQVGNARGSTNFSQYATGPAIAQAWIEIAKIYIAQSNDQAAFSALQNAGQAAGGNRQLADQVNTLMMETSRRLNQDRQAQQQQQQQQPQPAYNPPPPYRTPPYQQPRPPTPRPTSPRQR